MDVHGFLPATLDSDIRDPLVVQRPGRFERFSGGVGVLGEFAKAPLVGELDGDRVALIDDLFVANLSGFFALHERLRLQVMVPFYGFSGTSLQGQKNTGVGIADTRISAMISLVQPGSSGGIGVGLVPHLDLPTGQFHPWLGRRYVAGGGVIAFTVESGPLTVSANAGVQFEHQDIHNNLENADSVLAGFALGYSVSERLGINAEVSGRIPVPFGAVGSTRAPLEFIAHGRYTAGPRVQLLLGGAAGLSQGVGAASFRLFAGAAFGVAGTPRDRDQDGIPDATDACPDQPETRNGITDQDGCPDRQPSLSVVATYGGEPLPGVRVQLDGPVQRSFLTGGEPFSLEVKPDSMWVGTATIGSCLQGESDISMNSEDASLSIPLEPVPYGEVRVLVLSVSGDPVDGAILRFHSTQLGCVPSQPAATRENGEYELEVGRGQHELEVEHDGLVQRVGFFATPGKTTDVVVLLVP